MGKAENVELLQALAVTAELTGTELSEGAAAVFASDLARYPLPHVLGALRRCRQEVKGRLSLADVISRLADGRPGADEAWASLPFYEATSVVWNDEIAQAWGIAKALWDVGDKVGARFAFKQAYERTVAEARDKGAPSRWWASLGHDRSGREVAIRDAVDRGRLSQGYADKLLPSTAGMNITNLLTNQNSGMPDHVREQIKLIVRNKKVSL